MQKDWNSRPDGVHVTQDVYAGFFVRFCAYMIDHIIIFIGLLFVRLVFLIIGSAWSGFSSIHLLFQYSLQDILLYLFGVAYFVLCTHYTGTTLGKRVLRLRVIDENGKLPGWFVTIYRETIGRFLCSFILGVGYFMVGIQRKKQGLHDILAGTYVVYDLPDKLAYTTEPVIHTGNDEIKESEIPGTKDMAETEMSCQMKKVQINYEREGVGADEDI